MVRFTLTQLYFRCRDGSFEVAAVGFMHKACGPRFTQEKQSALMRILHPDHSDMRFYGGLRFDDTPTSRRSPEWAPYHGYTFVLPALEMHRDASGDHFLAANLRCARDLPLLHSLLHAIIATPRALHSTRPDFLIPRALHVDDLTDFPTWDAAMSTIMQHFSADEYDKIVLARQKRFHFARNACPNIVQLVAALDEPNRRQQRDMLSRRGAPDSGAAVEHGGRSALSYGGGSVSGTTRAKSSERTEAQSTRGTYLFCLQLDHNQAFVGCTPERLFRLQGASILTEALAGTVRTGQAAGEGAVLSELLSQKNLEEHRFVVEYIRSALSRTGVIVETSGPHVLRLPRLLHLSTEITGNFPDYSVSSDNHEPISHASAPGHLYRLLRTMHPTPAVCGMPRERTMTELGTLEDFDRGFFAGPLGWFSRDASEFCVAIRSALVQDTTVTAYAGSGIVQASESQSEWDETELKMSAFTEVFTGARAAPISPQGPLFGACNGVNSDTILSGFGSDRGMLSSRLCQNGESVQAALCSSQSPSSSSVATLLMDSRTPSMLDADRTAKRFPSSPYFDSTQLAACPNMNALWGCAAVEELCRNGIDTFFVAPGSRSAPLAIGIVRSRHARMYITHDERGAGFLAVGYARATGRAAAVITSSGTAVANLLPAAVEARADHLPMILLTADRPPELRDVGANQAIDQVGIFGRYVLWAKDVPCPTDVIPLRNLLSDIDYAVAMCGSASIASGNGNGALDCGPVHINFMFREKLAPDYEAWDRQCLIGLECRWAGSLQPLTAHILSFGSQQMRVGSSVLTSLRYSNAGIIIVGGGMGCAVSEEDRLSICKLSDALGWPVIADIASGMRFDGTCRNLVPYADQILASQLAVQTFVPDCVLQFGEHITSKRVSGLISNASFSVNQQDFCHIVVSSSNSRCDPSFTVSHRIRMSPALFLNALMQSTDLDFLIDKGREAPTGSKLSLMSSLTTTIDSLFNQMVDSMQGEPMAEPWCARCLSAAVERPSALFVGNSMPIRDFDGFAACSLDGARVRIGANRGASGIDGILSSGIGFGIGWRLPVTIVLGDMSMLHDLNALHLLKAEDADLFYPVTVVVVNNGGGGIFSLLPIAKHRDVFSPVFDTPHSVRFQEAANMFGMEYRAVHSTSELFNVISRPAKSHRFIEVIVSDDHAGNVAQHQRIAAAVAQQVSKALT